MTENDYIEELKKRWPRTDDAALEVIARADEATCAFPRSPKLWCMRGNLIELGPENSPYSLDDALTSYKRAIEIDPQFVEAWEEIGYFYRNVLDDEDNAKPYFREAERLTGNHDPQSRARRPEPEDPTA
jgi:tetratricopeptide (TPR) repeat protein